MWRTRQNRVHNYCKKFSSNYCSAKTLNIMYNLIKNKELSMEQLKNLGIEFFFYLRYYIRRFPEKNCREFMKHFSFIGLRRRKLSIYTTMEAAKNTNIFQIIHAVCNPEKH